MSLIISVLLLGMCVISQSLRTDLSDNNFAAWQENRGDWIEVGETHLNPDDPQLLTTSPGTGVFVNGATGRTRHLVSKQKWGDMRLFIEFMVPENSNSGVYFMGRYEIQIRDSYQKESHYPGNECGGIYQRWDENREPKGFEGISPQIDAARPAGQWQWFEAVFRAPRFDASGTKISNARFEKIYHNGFLIHENVEITGPTRASLYDDEQATGPLLLQGDHGPVAYRTIRVAPADVNPFFAMDTGTRDERHQTFQQQVEMLKRLGYDGMDHTGVDDVAEHLFHLDQNGLRLFAVYLDVWADREKQWANEGLEKAIEQLKGRDVVLWVPIRSHDYTASDSAGDAAAVKIVQKIADLAAASGLDVALYPHSFFLMEKIGDALRIARKTDRANVGVTFNLCHWLRTDNSDLKETLTNAAPFLQVVTINGADQEGDWQQLIQPLDGGEFDVAQVVRILADIDYSGPIGLQGYGIGGDVNENLKRSMQAWQKLNMHP
ncbi:DUF1080 domain-containing protein [candidate division KSB1 bacterium]|nr:DUF1080 domain-containing protein [candidate division KSB1 bacterium]